MMHLPDAPRLDRVLAPLLEDLDRDPAALDALVAEHLLGWHRLVLPDGGVAWHEPAERALMPRRLGPGERWWTARIEFAWTLVDVLARHEGMVAFALRRGLVKARPWLAEFDSLITSDARAGDSQPAGPSHPSGAAGAMEAPVAIVAAALRLSVADPALVAVLLDTNAPPRRLAPV